MLGDKSFDTNLTTFKAKAVTDEVIEAIKNQEGMSNIDFSVHISKINLEIVGDKERIQ